MEFLNASNDAGTRLTQSVSSIDISVEVEDVSKFPKPPFLVSINDEIIKVTQVDGNKFGGLERGQEGTKPSSHPVGSVVENRFTAGMYSSLVDSISTSPDMVWRKIFNITLQQDSDYVDVELDNVYSELKIVGKNINCAGKSEVRGVVVSFNLDQNRVNYDTWYLNYEDQVLIHNNRIGGIYLQGSSPDWHFDTVIRLGELDNYTFLYGHAVNSKNMSHYFGRWKTKDIVESLRIKCIDDYKLGEGAIIDIWGR